MEQKMNLVFTELELNRIRELQGAVIHSVRTCHPWFQPYWEGSRRLDLDTSVGTIGFSLTAHNPPSAKFTGEIFSLRLISNADEEPWPLDQHKGNRRVDRDESCRTRTVQNIALRRQIVTLVSGETRTTFVRDLGISMEVLQHEGGQKFDFAIGMEIEQTQAEVVAGVLNESENRIGIHCHPGHPIVKLGIGDSLHVRLETVPLTQ
jgi:hypothetical protein